MAPFHYLVEEFHYLYKSVIGLINKLKIFEEKISPTWNSKTDLKFVQSGVSVWGGLLINLKESPTNR